jgi:methionine synthase
MGNEALCVISVDFRLYGLLDLKGVGISLAENGMMKPYAGVSGLMFVHPESRCFDLGNIGENQLEDHVLRHDFLVDAGKRIPGSSLLKK